MLLGLAISTGRTAYNSRSMTCANKRRTGNYFMSGSKKCVRCGERIAPGTAYSSYHYACAQKSMEEEALVREALRKQKREAIEAKRKQQDGNRKRSGLPSISEAQEAEDKWGRLMKGRRFESYAIR